MKVFNLEKFPCPDSKLQVVSEYSSKASHKTLPRQPRNTFPLQYAVRIQQQ